MSAAAPSEAQSLKDKILQQRKLMQQQQKKMAGKRPLAAVSSSTEDEEEKAHAVKRLKSTPAGRSALNAAPLPASGPSGFVAASAGALGGTAPPLAGIPAAPVAVANPSQGQRQGQGHATAPSDPQILKAIHNLSVFVAKNGRSFEQVVKNKSGNDPKFSFLFDTTSSEHAYYQECLTLEEANNQAHLEAQAQLQAQAQAQAQAASIAPWQADAMAATAQPVSVQAMPPPLPQAAPRGKWDEPPHVQANGGQTAYSGSVSGQPITSDGSAPARRRWDDTPPSLPPPLPAPGALNPAVLQALAAAAAGAGVAPVPGYVPPVPGFSGNISVVPAFSGNVPGVAGTAAPAPRRKSRFSEGPPPGVVVPLPPGAVAPGLAASAATGSRGVVPPPLPPTDEDSIADDLDFGEGEGAIAKLNAAAGGSGSGSSHEGGRRHHIGDYLPQTEMEKFYAKARGETFRPDDKYKLTAANKGHNMLSKMGWTEGTGLGRKRSGIAAPIQAEQHVKGAGVGSSKPEEASEDDDAFTLYKKRMALSYRFRPNPLGNPRAAYWDDPTMNKGATDKLG